MSWVLFRTERDSTFALVGFDSELSERAPLAELPFACEVTISAPSVGPHDLPGVDDAIDAAAARLGGVVAATIRRPGRMWVLVHLPSEEGARSFETIPVIDGSVTATVTRDPGWTLFDRARPVGMEVQAVDDFTVWSQLIAEGDTGGVRPIDHYLTGLGAVDVEALTQSLGSVGFVVEQLTLDDGSDVLVAAHDADPADITPDSWTIRQIAERFGATYDGWGSPVVRPTPTADASARRGGLFRRR